MSESYDLTKLDANTFEHMINTLAIHVLGSGHTGFGPGSDGGRDGYFEGEAPYPSETDRWSGRWYIQSKYHKPHLSKDAQQWLQEQIKEEIAQFKKPESKRKWPDNWIVVTNVDPSGVPMTGAFDNANTMVLAARPTKKMNFHIWGGSKILDLLTKYPAVADRYGHFLTPGNVLNSIYQHFKDSQAEIENIVRHLVVKQFTEQQFTKLEQAGSAADTRPGIHRLFIDLPFRCKEQRVDGLILDYLAQSSSDNHRIDPTQPDTKEWRRWNRHPSRARVWFVRGGPGQGKSTIGQYFCQIQRAALILQEESLLVIPREKSLAEEVAITATEAGYWPTSPRIPIQIELKDFAQWYGRRGDDDQRGVLTYLAHRIGIGVEQAVLPGTLKRALKTRSWVVIFDGLDEVPSDVKDSIASELCHFVDSVAVECDADLLTVCTSRPQGYSGQFASLDGPTIDLVELSPQQALACARPVISLERTEAEADQSMKILTAAIESSSVRELMTTPLQSHIMAVVVRDGGRPPERRWQLFTNFYQVIKRREANRNLRDLTIAKLLREDDQLLKTVHNRLGFILHSRAETSQGAQTHLSRDEFKTLVTTAVAQMLEGATEDTVSVLMRATTDRLVLVNTPDDGNHVRYDVRPLQEFFAAEFLYEAIDADQLRLRIEVIAGDSHWREVMHFMLSALVENDRRTELAVVVDVLMRLNEGVGDSTFRLLQRRFGRGSLLAARLLQEGVLEQDRRVRDQFRRCLEPLSASTLVGVLEPLLRVNQNNTLIWLCNLLVDTIKESNQSESVGAAIVLTHVLPDGNLRIEEVCEAIMSASPSYIAAVLTARNVRAHPERGDNAPYQQWLLDLLVKLLLKVPLLSVGPESLAAISSILALNREQAHRLAIKNGLTTRHLTVLDAFLDDTYDRTHQEREEEDLGIVIGSRYTEDWTTGTRSLSPIPKDEASGLSGILCIVNTILIFGQTREYDDFSTVLDWFKQYGVDYYSILPGRLRALFVDIKSNFDQLCRLNKSEFEGVVSNSDVNPFTMPRPWARLTFKEKVTPTDFIRTLDILPDIALDYWSGYLWHGFPHRVPRTQLPFDRNSVIDPLLGKALASPKILLRSPHSWGSFCELAPAREGEIRQALLSVADCPVVMSYRRASLPDDFTLHLPEEAKLLPHLLPAMTHFSESHFPFYHGASLHDAQMEFRGMQSALTTLFPDLNNLERVALDPNMSTYIRGSAALFYLLHPQSTKEPARWQQTIVDAYNAENGGWFLECVASIFLWVATEADPAARTTVAKLLDLSRNDYKGRMELERLLSMWREVSHAPVNRAKVQDQWISNV